ncbi:hypothetical protein TNCV_698791 [Trichonephila clavipes]|nr:hypothetical protein TNCV_698791 [Trichonephila clavipes]
MQRFRSKIRRKRRLRLDASFLRTSSILFGVKIWADRLPGKDALDPPVYLDTSWPFDYPRAMPGHHFHAHRARPIP